MKVVIETKDLDKHLPAIVFSENLKGLTAEQIESVAWLMEIAYRKGYNDASNRDVKDYIEGFVCGTAMKQGINTSDKDIEKVVHEVFDKMFKKCRLLTENSNKRHSGPCVSETGDGPCEKCNEKGASNLHNVVINIQTDKVIEGVVERITKDLDKIIANKALY